MKNFTAIVFIVLMLIAGHAYSQPGVTFKTTNYGLNVNNFEFDIEIQASSAGTTLYQGQIFLTFNSASLSSEGNDWIVTLGDDFVGKYNILKTPGASDITIGLLANNFFSTNPADFTSLTGLSQKLVSISVSVISGSEPVNISFVPAQMSEIANAYGVYDGNGDFSSYTFNPIPFSNAYMERIFTAANNFQDLGGGISDGSVPKFTSIIDGLVPVMTTDPLLSSALRIHQDATVLISPISSATITGELDIIGDGNLIIESNEAGTGSVIAGSATTNGKAIAERYMTTEAWHYISSPLSGQSIAEFLADNTIIPNQVKDLVTVRGMMDYNPAANDWNAFFANDKGGNLLPGDGYAVRTSVNGVVEFSGEITTGPVTLTSLVANSWNLVGNPYTSGLGINDESTLTNFLSTNIGNLDDSYAAIYLWDKTDSQNEQPGNYSFISNALISIPGAAKLTQGFVQPGQGFLVKMNDATSLNFTTAMQSHVNNIDAPFKSAKSWPAIALDVNSGQHSSAAYIGFNNYMTPGLDPTYDIGAYRGDADLLLYSRLIEDNGVNFALQCLPVTNPGAWIIPLGIDSKSGGEITFSAKTIGLHASSTVVLEDRLNNVFTPLKTPGSFYRATLAANTSSVGRFFLHASYQTTSIDDELTAQELKAYMVRNEIVIDGRVSSKAVATLYDVQGRSILVLNLKEGYRNTMSAQGLKTGFYLLQVTDNGQKNTIKIPVVAQ